jgi:hypothetical protein
MQENEYIPSGEGVATNTSPHANSGAEINPISAPLRLTAPPQPIHTTKPSQAFLP